MGNLRADFAEPWEEFVHAHEYGQVLASSSIMRPGMVWSSLAVAGVAAACMSIRAGASAETPRRDHAAGRAGRW